jgi:hypothetical protein
MTTLTGGGDAVLVTVAGADADAGAVLAIGLAAGAELRLAAALQPVAASPIRQPTTSRVFLAVFIFYSFFLWAEIFGSSPCPVAFGTR